MLHFFSYSINFISFRNKQVNNKVNLLVFILLMSKIGGFNIIIPELPVDNIVELKKGSSITFDVLSEVWNVINLFESTYTRLKITEPKDLFKIMKDYEGKYHAILQEETRVVYFELGPRNNYIIFYKEIVL